MIRLGIPLEFYESYWEEYPGIPEELHPQLRAFFQLASFDPDDRGFRVLCVADKRRRDRYAYRLGDDYWVYWEIVREERRFLSIWPARPIKVKVLAIERVHA